MTMHPTHSPAVSARASALTGNSLTELLVMARAGGAVDLAVGTPGYPETSAGMIAEAHQAMLAGHNQYEHPAGIALLRERIADMLGDGADPATEITVTTGATEALHVALLATVDPGDEVVLLSPGYEQITAGVNLAGARPRFVPLHAPNWRFQPEDLAAAFNERTRAIVLNTPGNPTGRVLSRTELEEIAGLCERWDVSVICDEVYRDFTFDGRRHVSVAEVPGLAERAVVVGSLSKSHAVSGWRLGFLRADRERTAVLRRVHELTTNGTATPLQVAAGRAALTPGLAVVTREMNRRRDAAQEIFGAVGMEFSPVEGGCFLFADISRLTGGRQDCGAFVRDLLDRAGVLIVPGSPFFSDPGQGAQYVRIAFNRKIETLREAQRRMGDV
ncbi:pyridoxal phosphate-dependent aminotransferase [Streptomyces sp. NPDC001508]|uniref:pyridoxal phosphate-dependent aminotransferase n=1 Tax=Streptomyces sp. NPDC001508 TaxID=3154656 RepID=UPI00331F11DE